jgi:plasmid stabilization system protein ParE
MALAWSNLARNEPRPFYRFSVRPWGSDVAKRSLQDARTAARAVALAPGRARPVTGHLLAFAADLMLTVGVDRMRERVIVPRIRHVLMEIERHSP